MSVVPIVDYEVALRAVPVAYREPELVTLNRDIVIGVRREGVERDAYTLRRGSRFRPDEPIVGMRPDAFDR